MRRAALVGAAALLFLIAVTVAGLLVVNGRLLPAATARLERRLSETCSCEVSLGRPRLRPFRGVEIRDVTVTTASDSVRLEADRVRVRMRLRTLGRLRRAASSSPAALADAGLLPEEITLSGVRVQAAAGPLRAPVRARFAGVALTHEPEAGTLRLTAEPHGREEAVSARLRADYRNARLTGTVRTRGLPIPPLSAAGVEISGGRLSADLSVDAGSAAPVRLTGALSFDGAEATAPVVAPGVIRPLDVALRLRAAYDPLASSAPPASGALPKTVTDAFPRGRLTVEDATVDFNGVTVGLQGTLTGLAARRPHPVSGAPGAIPRLTAATLSLPPTEVSRIKGAVPGALRGPLETLSMRGTFAWDLDISVPRYDFGALRWTARTDLQDFRVMRIAEAVNPYVLNDAFVHTIRDTEVDFLRHVRIPAATAEHRPGNPAEPPRGSPTAGTAADPAPWAGAPDPTYTYVRLSEMSEWVPRAVLTAEDGDFYYHGGVNFRTLAEAMERNIREGDVVLGASTISMQLVKMLFLDDDRIFARKLQEVFLVYLMEHQVPVTKDRILEIYLNIAEFGPGIFGIHDAARYYFDSSAEELTVGEATWLATILPAPKRFHWYYEQGEISEGWFVRMKSYYDIMLERERMSREEYERAIENKPAFAR